MQYRKLIELKKLPNNPRTIKDDSFKKLCKSIKDNKDYFEARPLILSDRTGELIIIGGNQRYEAAKSIGLEEVPTYLIENLTEEREKEITIRDNVSNGSWDWDILSSEFELGDLEDWGLDVPDLEIDEEEPEVEEDEVPEVKKDPFVKKGDLWELGTHRLMCGDSTLIDDVDKLMGGEKADAVITDPPYGIGIDGQKESKSKSPKHNRKFHEFKGWDKERPDVDIFNFIVSLGIPSVIWGGNYFADLLPPTRGWIYWDKGQNGLSMSDGELAWTNSTKPLRAVVLNRAALEGSIHPTQKPIKIIDFSMKNIDAGTGVLDLFLGSGSTLIACEQTKRKCFGMELDEHYCSVIITRWLNYMIKENKDITLKCNGEDINYKEVLDER